MQYSKVQYKYRIVQYSTAKYNVVGGVLRVLYVVQDSVLDSVLQYYLVQYKALSYSIVYRAVQYGIVNNYSIASRALQYYVVQYSIVVARGLASLYAK